MALNAGENFPSPRIGSPFKSSFFLWGVALIVFFGLLVSSANTYFGALTLKEGDHFSGILERLGVLIVLALFVERLVEVYVIGFHEQDQINAKSAVADAAEKLALTQAQDGVAVSNETQAATMALEEARNRHSEIDKITKKRALIVSLVIGTLIGLCGVSILSVLLAEPAKMPLPIRLVDIVMVGALIAGGALPLHDMMQTLTNVLARSKQQSYTAPVPPSPGAPPNT